jgi:hypothetical protein
VGPGAYYYRGVMPQKFTAEMGKAIVDACKGPFPKGIQPVSFSKLKIAYVLRLCHERRAKRLN